MNQYQEQLNTLNSTVDQLPEEHKVRFNEFREVLYLMADTDPALASLAIGVVGLELAIAGLENGKGGH